MPMAEAPPRQACAGTTITPKIGAPPLLPPLTARRLQKDPRKIERDKYVRNYICRSYKTKPFDLPAGTTKQDFDQACKGVQLKKIPDPSFLHPRKSALLDTPPHELPHFLAPNSGSRSPQNP